MPVSHWGRRKAGGLNWCAKKVSIAAPSLPPPRPWPLSRRHRTSQSLPGRAHSHRATCPGRGFDLPPSRARARKRGLQPVRDLAAPLLEASDRRRRFRRRCPAGQRLPALFRGVATGERRSGPSRGGTFEELRKDPEARGWWGPRSGRGNIWIDGKQSEEPARVCPLISPRFPSPLSTSATLMWIYSALLTAPATLVALHETKMGLELAVGKRTEGCFSILFDSYDPPEP